MLGGVGEGRGGGEEESAQRLGRMKEKRGGACPSSLLWHAGWVGHTTKPEQQAETRTITGKQGCRVSLPGRFFMTCLFPTPLNLSPPALSLSLIYYAPALLAFPVISEITGVWLPQDVHLSLSAMLVRTSSCGCLSCHSGPSSYIISQERLS